MECSAIPICILQQMGKYTQGRSQGWKGGKFPPTETEKIVCENDFISEGSIFSNKFSKIKIKIK